MKGQVFLLTAVIIVAALVSFRGYMATTQFKAEKDILDVGLDDLVFKNIETETRQVIKFSITNPGSVTENAIDYLNFTRLGSERRSLDFQAVFVGAEANSTTQLMNITAFNFLRKSGLNITVILNTSTEQTNSSSLNDGQRFQSNFTFTRGGIYNLTVYLPSENYAKYVVFETEASRDTYTGFFDIRLVGARTTNTAVFHQSTDLS